MIELGVIGAFADVKHNAERYFLGAHGLEFTFSVPRKPFG
jgi:hypothetical protein